MAPRRLFSCLLLASALVGADSGRHEAGALESRAARPIVLEPGDYSAPSPFLGASALTDADGLRHTGFGSVGRLLPRSVRATGTLPVRILARVEARVRATRIAVLDITSHLTLARAGDLSARGTSLPPPDAG